jgi:hypothetical protein
MFWSFEMGRSRVISAIFSLTAVILSAPIILISAQDSQKPRKILVKKEGWLVPGQNYFKDVSEVVEKNIEGVAVTQKVLKAPTEIIVDVDGNTVKPFVKRKSSVRLFSVYSFSVYESKGRIFAYGVDLVPVFFIRGKDYWEKSYAGAMYDLFYVDEDGDGIFESRYGGLPLRQLPDWVRRHV